MVVFCHFLRVLLFLTVRILSFRSASTADSPRANLPAALAHYSFATRHLSFLMMTLMCLFCCLFYFVHFSSNQGSNPDIHSTIFLQSEVSVFSELSVKFHRAFHILSSFIQRMILPSELRIHYQSPPVRLSFLFLASLTRFPVEFCLQVSRMFLFFVDIFSFFFLFCSVSSFLLLFDSS
jgi:hypothetical protein